MVGRRRYRLEFVDTQLERREMLDASSLSVTPAQVTAASVSTDTSATPAELAALAATSGSSNLFNQNGIKIGRLGVHLSDQFKGTLNNHLKISADQTFFIIKAFKNFEANYTALTVNPAPPPGSPTLTTLLAALQNDVDFALTHHQKPTNRVQVSVPQGLKASALAAQSLVPFANAQIAQFGATVAATPPVPGPNGTTVVADPLPSVNIAINAILNAVAEQSVHPNLFLKPSDFYISTLVKFNIMFVGAPAKTSIGYFVRGPGGALLPGAPVPANFPGP